jgi:hypothetical protein
MLEKLLHLAQWNYCTMQTDFVMEWKPAKCNVKNMLDSVVINKLYFKHKGYNLWTMISLLHLPIINACKKICHRIAGVNMYPVSKIILFITQCQ